MKPGRHADSTTDQPRRGARALAHRKATLLQLSVAITLLMGVAPFPCLCLVGGGRGPLPEPLLPTACGQVCPMGQACGPRGECIPACPGGCREDQRCDVSQEPSRCVSEAAHQRDGGDD
jgi:hypothetical protein